MFALLRLPFQFRLSLYQSLIFSLELRKTNVCVCVRRTVEIVFSNQRILKKQTSDSASLSASAKVAFSSWRKSCISADSASNSCCCCSKAFCAAKLLSKSLNKNIAKNVVSVYSRILIASACAFSPCSTYGRAIVSRLFQSAD